MSCSVVTIYATERDPFFRVFSLLARERECVCVCVRERERESLYYICVCVYVCVYVVNLGVFGYVWTPLVRHMSYMPTS